MSLLDAMLAATRARLERTRREIPAHVVEQRARAAPPVRGLARALAACTPAVIAEIKRASPAVGTIDATLDAGATAGAYARGGASAISVLTEPEFFLGDLADLGAARAAGLPVLRKDFILDPYQVAESRAWGADAVLVIARCVPDLAPLLQEAAAWGMDALVEVYDERDIAAAVAAGATLIGINHRDLDSFEVDPGRTARLAPAAPADALVVALSGVSTRAEVEDLVRAGARAVLVGEALVRAPDPAAKVAELAGR